MEITEAEEAGRIVAVLEGRLDTATAPLTEARLIEILKLGRGVIADLSQVRYVSSAGLRVLLKAAKHAKTSGVHFSVAGLQAPVREVFEISGFDKIIPAFGSRAEAGAA